MYTDMKITSSTVRTDQGKYVTKILVLEIGKKKIDLKVGFTKRGEKLTVDTWDGLTRSDYAKLRNLFRKQPGSDQEILELIEAVEKK